MQNIARNLEIVQKRSMLQEISLCLLSAYLADAFLANLSFLEYA